MAEKKDTKSKGGYEIRDDGSVVFDDAEPSDETREAAQKDVEKAAKKRDEEAEEAAKKAGEEAAAVQATIAEQSTSTRETADGGMPREKGTV
jgi:hypothetical protein